MLVKWETFLAEACKQGYQICNNFNFQTVYNIDSVPFTRTKCPTDDLVYNKEAILIINLRCTDRNIFGGFKNSYTMLNKIGTSMSKMMDKMELSLGINSPTTTKVGHCSRSSICCPSVVFTFIVKGLRTNIRK
ncbi:hypothetical protein P8452_35171 [Trifolium repens]|nr:hypothetical protein P8452_35171 [Trifolium repens]